MVGYQAPGTLGHLLLSGEPVVRIHGEEVSVAARIRNLDQYSGHADHDGLVRWREARAPAPYWPRYSAARPVTWGWPASPR